MSWKIFATPFVNAARVSTKPIVEITNATMWVAVAAGDPFSVDDMVTMELVSGAGFSSAVAEAGTPSANTTETAALAASRRRINAEGTVRA